MKYYTLLMRVACVLLVSNTLLAQNKVPTLAQTKPQTALLVKKDTTHKKLVSPKPASARIVAPLVTLSKTGQIVEAHTQNALPKTSPTPEGSAVHRPVPPQNVTVKTPQTKPVAQPVVQTKNVQAKSVPPSVAQPQTAQTKPVQQVAQPQIVQTKPVQQVAQTKIVQTKPVQQAAQAKIVQTQPAQQVAQAQMVAPKFVPQQGTQIKNVQTNAVSPKTTPVKVSPNNLLLASVLVPKTKTGIVAKKARNVSLRASPETEFRGVWVSTVSQVDFPTNESVDPSVLKSEWLRLLKFYKSLNLNAVIVQVRPTADAIYPSKLVPYTKYLTGQSGKPLAGNFDMLKFMIETSHASGMEFHAWINPYRVLVDSDTTHLAANHVFKAHRNWVLKYGKEHHLNPGLPEVWKHITAVTEEIVVNYDIDAIHFDDYFYPYRIEGEELKDGDAFKKYGKKFKNINDWRRANTDSMFFNVRQAIKKHKPSVQLGVSPFAVWRNKTDSADTHLNPGLLEGSETHAYQSCYADLYADVVTWMRRGWLDYVAPEVYFHKNHPLVGYENAVDWWLKNSFGTPVYISHAIYKVNNKEKYPEWRDPKEIPRQLDLVRTKQNVKGLVFFSSRWLLENQLGVTDSIRNNFFYQPTKLPKVK